MQTMAQQIEQLYDRTDIDWSRTEPLFQRFLEALETGEIRAAEKEGDNWVVRDWVKKGILLGFRHGTLTDMSIENRFPFWDKSTFPVRMFSKTDQVRLVPGGSSVRRGAFVSPGVVVMPPAYINTGAFVDRDTMVDSHALVGSCAQIGARVHLSAAAQIGGVLEPISAVPVVVEDNVLVGGNAGIYEGTIVGHDAVIGAGTVLTRSIPVYDMVNETLLKGSEASPLRIPPRAVVVPGSRGIANSEFGQKHALSVSCALIIKYRDERSDRRTALEDALRTQNG